MLARQGMKELSCVQKVKEVLQSTVRVVLEMEIVDGEVTFGL
jgi:hypothetical protein